MGLNVTDKLEPAAATACRRAERAQVRATKAAAELAASGALDGLFAKIDAGEIELTGDGGFIPALIKATLERGLQAELTGHLGYEKGAPEASAFSNSPQRVDAEDGRDPGRRCRPRDPARPGGLVHAAAGPKGSRRLGGWTR